MRSQFLSPKANRIIVGTIFIFVFLGFLIINIPTWVLAKQIEKYSEHRLKLYNQNGTFWKGAGLLVATDAKLQHTAPLIFINWNLSLGFTKYIDIKFAMGDNIIANVYLNKNGVNLDKLNVHLSIIQVSQLVDVVRDLNISGNLHILTDHILLAKKSIGQFNINISHVSTSMSPVNPLGTYNMVFNVGDGKISISSEPGSILNIKGDGNANGLILNATIDPSKAEEMKQLITVMGMPRSDGSYDLKLF
jgi:hypothetical protein